MRQFQIGDRVRATAFTDCFGEYHPAVTGLVVTQTRTIKGYAPHYRIVATSTSDPFVYVEAAERFFEREG